VSRLLIFNHYFDHDIDALRDAAPTSTDIRVVAFGALRADAMMTFPRGIADNFEFPARPELEPHRRRFAARAREWLHDEYSRGPFDALILPSDQFFYVRALPALCHELGIPCIVVQKETTLSPNTMRELAEDIRMHAPPLVDWMTVCSERQREFWTLAGADPARLEIAGQPRFDLYRRVPRREREPRDGPTVLFFSYDMDAYHPRFGQGILPWKTLHAQTEAGLWELAREGWRVRIKPHPQQHFGRERTRLARAAGPLLDKHVELIHGDADARRLILDADVVVGFQTTALIESLIPDRPVVYTGWDPEAQRVSDELIPFHEWRDVVTVVDRAEQLAPAIRTAARRQRDADGRARAEAIVHQELGRVDGHAAARVLERIERLIAASAARVTPEARALRERLAARRPPRRLVREASRRTRTVLEMAGNRLGRGR
jgi:hypothetical protein